MTRSIPRAIRMCALCLLLVSLVGCAAADPGQPEMTTSPATPSSEQAEQTTEQEMLAELPPAPSDVSGMRGWFEQAFPEAPWLARITDIEYVKGEVPGSGGFSDAVVITTDLDFDSEQDLGQQIAAALGEADPDWAKQFVVWFSDGNNLQAGDIIDMTP